MTTSQADEHVENVALITPQEAAERIAAGALLIDVRREERRIENGEIADAIPVERTEIVNLFGNDPAKRLAGVDGHDTEIVVFCSSENGSRPVVEKLAELGYGNISHVAGGFTEWKKQGLPVRASGSR